MPNDGRWLYILTGSFALGILARSLVDIDMEAAVIWLLMSLILILASRQSGWQLLLLGLAGVAFSGGLARMEAATWSEVNPYFETYAGQTLTLEGVVAQEPDERSNTTHLYVATEQGLVLVTANKGREWRYGDRVRVEGEFKQPEAFATDLGREFNYRGYLLAKGVAYTSSFAEVGLLERDQGNQLIAGIFLAKDSFIGRLESLVPEPEAGLSLGLLLGVKRALGEDLEKDFRRSGVIHIVVLSGYNIMIVVAFILFVLGALFGRRASTLLGIASIALFAIMVGLSATVVRASIMAALLLIVGLTGRVYLALRGLFVAGALMILWNPYSLAFDVGFQLSFLATLGLIVFSPYLKEKLAILPEQAGLREFITATLATQLFVLPILLYQIGEFSVVAVVVNVLVLPVVPVAMMLAFLTGVASYIFLPAAKLLAYFTYLALKYIIAAAEWFASWDYAAFTVPAFPFYLVPVGYALLALLVYRLYLEPDQLADWTIVEDKN